MMDPDEVNAMRNMWIAVLANFASDQIRIFHASRLGRRMIKINNIREPIGPLEYEIERARRYMASKDFRTVCDMAGVDFNREQAITSMLEIASRPEFEGMGRDWIRKIRLAA